MPLSYSICSTVAVSGPDVIALSGLPVSLCFGVPKIVYTWSRVKAFIGLIGKLEEYLQLHCCQSMCNNLKDFR